MIVSHVLCWSALLITASALPGRLSKREDENFHLCDANEIVAVRDALDTASAMAYAASLYTLIAPPNRDERHNQTWEDFFDGDETVRNTVANVFYGIQGYHVNAPTRHGPIQWYCEQASRPNARCRAESNLTSFGEYGAGMLERMKLGKDPDPPFNVILCRRFFDQVPFSSGCHNPGDWAESYPPDQAHYVLRSVMQHPTLVGRQLHDEQGVRPIWLSADRHIDPVFRLPEDNIDSYAEYAAAIRHNAGGAPCAQTKAEYDRKKQESPGD